MPKSAGVSPCPANSPSRVRHQSPGRIRAAEGTGETRRPRRETTPHGSAGDHASASGLPAVSAGRRTGPTATAAAIRASANHAPAGAQPARGQAGDQRACNRRCPGSGSSTHHRRTKGKSAAASAPIIRARRIQPDLKAGGQAQRARCVPARSSASPRVSQSTAPPASGTCPPASAAPPVAVQPDSSRRTARAAGPTLATGPAETSTGAGYGRNGPKSRPRAAASSRNTCQPGASAGGNGRGKRSGSSHGSSSNTRCPDQAAKRAAKRPVQPPPMIPRSQALLLTMSGCQPGGPEPQDALRPKGW